MKKIWERLDAWFRKNTGHDLGLGKPASKAAITRAEKALGMDLPASFRASLEVHDGQAEPTIGWLPAGARLLPLKELVAQWEYEMGFVEDDPDAFETIYAKDRVRCVAMHAKRIPVAYAESATAGLYLDGVPGPKGVEGQVIYNHTECDFSVLGESFEELLTRYLTMLEKKKLVYMPDENDEWEFEGFILPPDASPGDDIADALTLAM